MHLRLNVLAVLGDPITAGLIPVPELADVHIAAGAELLPALAAVPPNLVIFAVVPLAVLFSASFVKFFVVVPSVRTGICHTGIHALIEPVFEELRVEIIRVFASRIFCILSVMVVRITRVVCLQLMVQRSVTEVTLITIFVIVNAVAPVSFIAGLKTLIH